MEIGVKALRLQQETLTKTRDYSKHQQLSRHKFESGCKSNLIKNSGLQKVTLTSLSF